MAARCEFAVPTGTKAWGEFSVEMVMGWASRKVNCDSE
jgi:hypothetical protein